MKAAYQPNERDSELLEELFAAVCNALTAHYGGRVRATSRVPQIFSYTNSFLLRYRISGHPHAIEHVYVKIRRHPKMTSLVATQESPGLHVRMREEYDTIAELYGLFSAAGAPFEAVRALAFVEGVNAIVLEEFAGRTLRETVMHAALRVSPAARRGRLMRRAKAAGRWLRHVHEAGRDDWRPLRADEVHEREIAPLLDGLRECGLGAGASPPSNRASSRAARRRVRTT